MHERDSLGAAVVGVAVLAIFGITGNSLASSWINHDAGWYLHVAGAWLDGATLYRDVIDTNPPLIIFLSAVPVWLGRITTIAPTALVKGLIVVMAVGASVLSYAALLRIYAARTPAALVSAAVAFFLLAYPGGDFGQREQIAVLFVLPYVLTSCLAVSGRSPGLRTSLISGVLGGIGFAIKPHFLLAFVLAELVVLAHRLAASGRWLRPSAAAAALTMLVYAVVVIVFVPQFLEVARHVVRVYGGLDGEPHVILALVDLRVWAAAAFAFAALHRWLPHRPVSLLLLAVATGFLGAAVVQMKG